MSETRYLVALAGRGGISVRNMYIALGSQEVEKRLMDLYKSSRMARLWDWSFMEWLISMMAAYGYDSVRIYRFDRPDAKAIRLKLEHIWEMLGLDGECPDKKQARKIRAQACRRAREKAPVAK